MLQMKEVNLFTKYLFTLGWHLSMNTIFMTKSKIIQFCRCEYFFFTIFASNINTFLTFNRKLERLVLVIIDSDCLF